MPIHLWLCIETRLLHNQMISRPVITEFHIKRALVKSPPDLPSLDALLAKSAIIERFCTLHEVSRGWALVKKVSGDVAHSCDNRCLSCIFHDRSTTYTGYTWYRTGSAYLRDINNHFYNSNTCTCNKYSRWECTCSVLRSADMKRQSSYLESKTIF